MTIMTKTTDMLGRTARRLAITPLTAVLIALALLIGALTLAIQNDRIGTQEKLRQTEVQARILAASVAAPLAFDDQDATSEFLNALRLNPEVQSAGAYSPSGNMVAGYSTAGVALPATSRVAAPVRDGRDLIVTAKVAQAGTVLGSVYLRTSIESWPRRALRYLGIALIVVMASLLVGVLGASYASLSDAHAKLRTEIEGRQQAEEALRQSQKMEAMGQLTGGVAHDFNNLLMVASSGLDLLERTTDPAKRERLRTGIRQAVDRGAKLTQQLLAFARRSPMHPEVIDPGERIRGMDTLLDRSMREDVEVRLELADGLWPIEVDPSQMEVALLNIALNARDAMPDGGTIVVSAGNLPGEGALPDRVRIAVTDTGTGIAPEMTAKIFEPFFTTKGVGQGTGLGLSQVYGFARSSAGEVVVDSAVGRGTTIALIIPRSAKAPPRKPEDKAPAPAAADGQRRILLVEDDDHVAAMVTEMLDALGMASERVASGDAAIARVEADAGFDMLLSDMVMPGALSGLDLVRAVARLRPELPAVLMTGYSAAAAAAAQEGIRLLHKPYRIEDLAGAIEAAIG
jgi:signal transduction histidine kinase